MRRIYITAVLMFFLHIPVNSDAALIRVEPGAKGVYSVQAVDFGEIGGVEVEIQYDTTNLSNPRVAVGSMLASTMFIPNTKFSASSVKIAAMSLSAIKGSGVLATITFDVKGENPPIPTVIRSKLAASTGASVKHETPVPATVVPTDTGRPPDTSRPPDTTIPSDTGGGGTYVSGSPSTGTITLPQDELAAAEAGRKTDYQPLVTDLRKDMTLPLGDSGSKKSSPGEQATEPGKEQQKKFVSYKSAVQLFRDFKGVKISKSLIPLFAEVSIPDFKQEPPIAFADGKTPLKITLVLKQTGSDSPKFLLQGANVKKLSGEGEEAITWTIDAIPKKDAVEAILTVLDGQTVMEFPLTIAPRIDPLLTKAKALSEADFATYLAKPLKFDLNKDGKFDAVDDFIYTANYIVAMKIKPEKAKKEEKVDLPKQGTKDEPKSKEPVKVKEDKAKTVEKPSLKK
jgi:hypothetical protein